MTAQKRRGPAGGEAPVTEPPTPLQVRPDEGFAGWLAGSGGSVAISTYQAGKLMLVGWDGRQMRLLPRQFDKPMGLDAAGDRLVLATRREVTIFANARLLAQEYLPDKPGYYDALYLPRATYHTNELNIHDLAIAGDDLWLVNTRFSCLMGLSHDFTFVPRWRPPFVSETVPEDRCHLNGLALVDGKPKYVTALGETDSVAGWRDGKATGGLLIDVETGEILLRGLAMPHSPRWHRGRLYILDSGAGELLQVDPERGERTVVCRLPGYLRGLTFFGDIALVGLCKIRETNIFGGMPVQERHEELLCGVAVINIRTGRTEGLFEFTAGCTEIYDVRFLPGIRKPNILNLEKPELQDAVAAPDFAYWLRPDKVIEDKT